MLITDMVKQVVSCRFYDTIISTLNSAEPRKQADRIRPLTSTAPQPTFCSFIYRCKGNGRKTRLTKAALYFCKSGKSFLLLAGSVSCNNNAFKRRQLFIGILQFMLRFGMKSCRNYLKNFACCFSLIMLHIVQRSPEKGCRRLQQQPKWTKCIFSKLMFGESFNCSISSENRTVINSKSLLHMPTQTTYQSDCLA